MDNVWYNIDEIGGIDARQEREARGEPHENGQQFQESVFFYTKRLILTKSRENNMLYIISENLSSPSVLFCSLYAVRYICPERKATKYERSIMSNYAKQSQFTESLNEHNLFSHKGL